MTTTTEPFFPEKDEPLRRDVGFLGELLGRVLEEQGGAELFERVERSRVLAREHRAGREEAADDLEATVSGLPVDEAMALARAFSAYFSVVNMAERVHRIRRRRDYLANEEPQTGSLEASLRAARDAGLSRESFEELLGDLRILPVFTAHPTEATRRTLLVKEQRMASLLVRRMVERMVPYEERVTEARLRNEITLGWQTDEHLDDRPTVADEVEHVVFYLTDVIYRIVPAFYRALEEAAAAVYGEDAARTIPSGIVRFGTWVGGDMDGNPAVGAETMRATLERQRELILKRYVSEVRDLFGHLSQSVSHVPVAEALLERIRAYGELLPGVAAGIPPRYRDMPYRVFLWLISARLEATERDVNGRYANPDELVADLAVLADSLLANRGEHAGLRRVQRLRRRVETFGFHVATLDVREDALSHRRAVGQLLGVDDFEEREPVQRTELLSAALAADGEDPSGPEGAPAELTKVMAVLAEIRESRRRFGARAVGPYIISMAQGVDDALGLLWLGRRAGLLDENGAVALDIAPLFETVDDLKAAGPVMAELYAHPQYREHLRARGDDQIVMLGYSDSNRESGIAASRWELQRAQEELVAESEASGVRVTLFHGRGGTVSRGGSKPRNAILAEPPRALRGRLRLTEQGEIIHAKYGLRDLALRTLELMGGALIEATSASPTPAAESWREAMSVAARESRTAYQKLVFESDGFYEYFRGATPIDVIECLCIGSRPVARRSKAGIANLRAIPWVFAWTQSRLTLPGWYGLGEGLRAAEEAHGLDTLREMAREWPFFQNLISDAEMVLAKADLDIARRYSRLAGDLHDRFFPEIERAFESTREIVCRISGHERLLEAEPVLERAILLRNPYIDPMSLVQIDLLRRWREGDRKDEELTRVLMSTVKGIARGLLNTG